MAARISRLLSAKLAVLVMTMPLASCVKLGLEDEYCHDAGLGFEISNDPFYAENRAKAMAATGMALAELGFVQSDKVANQFDPISPSPAVQKVRIIYGDYFFIDKNHVWSREGPSRIYVIPYGACSDAAIPERKKYADSIKEKLATALQPYATEKVIVTDTTDFDKLR